MDGRAPYPDFVGNPTQHAFSPYSSNGGTIVGISGEDFCVLAGDTRLSQGYEIMSRTEPKVTQLNNTSVIAQAGFKGDATTLLKNLQYRIAMYKHDHGKEISCPAIAQMLSNTLYYKRFFPYYVYNIVGGIDAEGKGCVFSYDPVGSYERTGYIAAGTGQQLLQPLLDNQLGRKNISPDVPSVTLTQEQVVALVKDIFVGATEREIYTGDNVDIFIITKDGVKEERVALRRD